MPPAYVKAYVKRGKTDAADAKAICEAVTPRTMRFVPIKSPESQAVLSLHGARDLMVKQRAQAVNMLRGLVAEFGIDLARGIHHRLALARRIAEGDAPAVPPLAVRVVTGLAEQVHDLQARITDLDKDSLPVTGTANWRSACPAPRHRDRHGKRTCCDRHRSRSVQIGSTLRRVARLDPAAEVERW